ncbi:Uncharacterized protein dnl_09840 [Desulfonema limicola]|uniref:Uncharacterized protein n=1 Tax=Desulfonema limicola TaxID=45656 RepID=A0A975B4Q3_9BACT|nr:hypothetical protein [Desulfonema limicola]QTA78751.1 Uncharacterized protein dnl_09840 [Desulfonema limicola]
MKERKEFDLEMNRLEREIGADVAAVAYFIFTESVRWLRLDGHGNIHIPAHNQKFGSNFKIESVRRIPKT